MYKIETDSSASSEDDRSPVKRKVTNKKSDLGNAADVLPYGRRRSCWKRNYNDGEKLIKSVPEAGIITCAICGIQRYYKFIKQTKKFGLQSCEPCRKFITSMIASVRNGEQFVLSCGQKGPENCLLTESISTPNGASRSKRDSLSNIRCKACWLSLCLVKYEMHPGLRNSLAQFIAEDDRPSFSTNNAENEFGEIDIANLTKKRSHGNFAEKSCIKALTTNYIERAGLLGMNESSGKVVIFRIKDV